MYKPDATAEVSLTQKQSELHKASDAYCDLARKKGWASGETGIGGLADILTGKTEGETDPYWKRIRADQDQPTAVLTRVRADVKEVVSGLNQLSSLAQTLMSSVRPAKEDVTQFELALIHARQARESFSDAISQANRRASAEADPGQELDALDRALTRARMVADDLAAARTADGVAGEPGSPPTG